MGRVAVVVGTRPDVIKLAPVVDALREGGDLEPFVIASGQHRELLELAASSVRLQIDWQLSAMKAGQSLASLTSRLLTELDDALESAAPDFVVVQGDTATMLGAALAAFYRRLPIGHVEAGLRTGDVGAPFPEEANRRLVTPLVTLHFAPTETARTRLLGEGVSAGSVLLTGNTIVDALQAEQRRQADPTVAAMIDERLAAQLGQGWADRQTVLVTVHRRESIGPALEGVLDAVSALAGRFADHQFCLPVHLNPAVQRVVRERLAGRPNISLTEPLSYAELIRLLSRCRLVMTDSGGIQEEAPVFGKPVVVMRETTERPEGVDARVAVLAGLDPGSIRAVVERLLTDDGAYRSMAQAASPYGDGQASARIVAAIRRFLAGRPI